MRERTDQGTNRGATQVAFASLNENIDVWGLPLDSNRRMVTATRNV